MRAQLMPLEGGNPIELTKDLILVGRKEDCDLRLDHKSVSKMHCVIVKTDGLLFLRDLGSTNGTRVNGTRVRRAALLPNDQLTIANYKFRVYLGPDAPIVAKEEHTQQMDAREVADLLKKAKAPSALDDSDEIPSQEQVRTNPLPDFYPDDENRNK